MTTTYRSVLRYLVVAWFSFMGACLICIIIRPDLFDHPDYGFSFYGSIAKTIVPFVLGLLVPAWCLWRIALQLKPFPRTLPFRLGLYGGALGLLGIVLTPMALSPVVWWTHIGISGLIALNQIALVIWIICRRGTTIVDYLLALAFLAGGIATALSGTWPGILGVYALGELVIFNTSLMLTGRMALRIASSWPKHKANA